MTVVYADVLFLINFCMDFLALSLCGAILHLPLRQKRLLLAALLGGLYAVAAALYTGYAIVSAIIGLFAAAILCAIGYGKDCGRRRFFTALILFFLVSWLLGGMITAFYGFLTRFFEKREQLLTHLLEGDGKLPLFFLLALLCALLITLGRRHLSFFRHREAVRLLLREGGREKTVSAFVDTGNTLCDPLSGRPCVIVDPSAASEVIPADILAFSRREIRDPGELSPESRRRIRLIPAESLGGSQLLVGYLPAGLVIGEGDEGVSAVDAVIVLDSREGRGFFGYGALVPSVLIP